MNPVELMSALDSDAKQLDKASTRLAKAMQEFEGSTDPAEWEPGPKLTWESLVDAEAERIYTEYEEAGDKKIPPEKVRVQRARSLMKAQHPELYADYHRLRSEIEGLQKWVSSKKETVSARQSVLSAEKALAGASGPQPSWSKGDPMARRGVAV